MLIDLLPPPAPILPGWARRRGWVGLGEPVAIGPAATLTVACRICWRVRRGDLEPGRRELVAHIAQGRNRRTEPAGDGQILYLHGAWAVALVLRAVERGTGAAPQRVLIEAVPTGQHPARSLAEMAELER